MERVAVLLVAGHLAVGGLTVLEGHRRGERLAVAVVGGALFPVAWAVWYVRDVRGQGRRRA